MAAQRAVVIGGGFGGLCAARVLSGHFAEVVVLEQDPVTAESAHRRGIPQAHHPHALLARGSAVLEGLFPGLGDELAARGATRADFGESARYRLPTGWAPRGRIGLPIQTATRVTLERCLRRRVLDDPRVTTRPGFTVDGLCWDAEGTRVTGVTGSALPDAHEEIGADLVVDASGRLTKLPTWLRAAGFGRPEEVSVTGEGVYTTRLFRAPSTADWTTVAEFPRAPDRRRGGVLVTTEDGHRLLTLMGADGQAAPTDPAGFLDYARTLSSPEFAETITGGEPLGRAHRMAHLDSRWVHYHRMPRWPGGLLCLGDAVCTLNPVHAQGMTVTAVQAQILGDLLDRGAADLPRVFQKRVARALALPWAMATAADLTWDPHPTPARARLAQWYLARLDDVIPGDPDVFRRFFLAAHLVRGPAVLLAPSVLWKVLRPPRRGDQGGAVLDQPGAGDGQRAVEEGDEQGGERPDHAEGDHLPLGGVGGGEVVVDQRHERGGEFLPARPEGGLGQRPEQQHPPHRGVTHDEVDERGHGGPR
ncbi:FAD-dependent oxidoreductase [Actinokineospora spheciospongiae]|uniref:FAD-dependent oxidoreductase n=1 Tax=Actinokineospora spheciospongiae TaxID=909613 RepID=UPI000DA0D972|nr:2-polyprenyl-6-methoxyphenol hydroxylase-like FAD-dependent oxidoreductase [Actinokineospora spheciospongiae]